MDIHVKAFPAVYLNSICTKHQCMLELGVVENKKYNTTQVLGATITTLRCREGGLPQQANCTDYWELSILAGGDVRIGQ